MPVYLGVLSNSDITLLEESSYTFPVVLDTEAEQIYGYGIRSVPTTFMIDKEGYIEFYVPGAMDEETMREIIEEVKGSKNDMNKS